MSVVCPAAAGSTGVASPASPCAAGGDAAPACPLGEKAANTSGTAGADEAEAAADDGDDDGDDEGDDEGDDDGDDEEDDEEAGEDGPAAGGEARAAARARAAREPREERDEPRAWGGTVAGAATGCVRALAEFVEAERSGSIVPHAAQRSAPGALFAWHAGHDTPGNEVPQALQNLALAAVAWPQ